MQTTPGNYQLVLNGKTTGLANAFTVTGALTGGQGVTFTDTDADQVYGDSAADLVQTALNASFTVNGLPVQAPPTSRPTRARRSRFGGGPTETVAISVSRDADGAAATVQSFLNAYNDIVQFIKDQDTAAAGKDCICRAIPCSAASQAAFIGDLQQVHQGAPSPLRTDWRRIRSHRQAHARQDGRSNRTSVQKLMSAPTGPAASSARSNAQHSTNTRRQTDS